MRRYILLRDKYCQRCGTPYNLECAHCFRRGHMNTRYDDRNCMTLCTKCHLYLDTHPKEKKEFFKARLGEQAFEMLRARANEVGRPDKKAIELWLKKELKEMGAKECYEGLRKKN